MFHRLHQLKELTEEAVHMVQILQPQAVEVHLQQDQELLVQTQAELEAEEVLLQTLFLALRHQVTVHLVQHLTQELFLEAVEVQVAE
tara:strand:- start:195 stop:455 length:261 start_codon:yes stop_codon:yes gene_type:complete